MAIVGLIGLVLTTALFAPARPLSAQIAERPSAFVAVRADTVVLHLTEAPSIYEGFVVYRGEPGGELELVTDEPIRPVRRPDAARVLIGDSWEDVLIAARVSDGADLLRRLRAGDFAGSVLSALYPGVARATGRRFEDAGRTPGETLEYRVVYVDAQGEETERSFSVTVAVEERVPEPVTGVEAESGDASTRLAWDYAAFEADPRDVVIGFHIERAEGVDGEYRRITPAPVLREREGPFEYLDDGLSNGVAYRYRVRTIDLLGRAGVPGGAVEVQPRDDSPPASPRELRTDPGDGRVLLVWRASPEPDVAGYHVERSVGRDAEYVRLNDELLPALEAGWHDTTAVGGTHYFYRVTAVDRSGNASEPSTPRSVVPDDDTAPAPPADILADVADRRVTLRWRASPSADVAGYRVWRGSTRGTPVRLNEMPVADTMYVDSGFDADGLLPGERYRIAVAAVDHAQNASDTVAVEVTVPDDEAPGAPTGLRAENVGARYVGLSWLVSPARDVVRYELTRRSPDGGEPVDLGEFDAAGPRAARDSSVARGMSYVYALVAVDGAGNRSEPVLDSLHVRRPTPPPPPRHATARPTDAGVEVTWERVIDDDLAGFHVYRSTLPTGVYERLTDSPVTDLRFVDPSGRDEHYYIIRAIDRSGNESDRSPAVSPDAGPEGG